MKPKNNNLKHVTDLAFKNINRLFVLSFKNGDNDSTRDSYDKNYMPNAFISNKPILIKP